MHNSLIRTPNWTIYICISIVSTRSTQWCSPIGIFDDVTQTGLTGLLDRSDRFAQIVQQTRYLPILNVNRNKEGWEFSLEMFKGDVLFVLPLGKMSAINRERERCAVAVSVGLLLTIRDPHPLL